MIKIYKDFLKSTKAHIVQQIFNPSQRGFRIGRSCLSQLLEQYDLILLIFTGWRSQCGCCLPGFFKSLRQCRSCNCPPRNKATGNWWKDTTMAQFLPNREKTVSAGEWCQFRTRKNVLSGIPQGNVLRPLIFLILICDIDKDISNIPLLMTPVQKNKLKQLKMLPYCKLN